MKIVLTGFEPFGGENTNPSQQILGCLSSNNFPGISLTTAVLPVDTQLAPRYLFKILDKVVPDAVLCLGQAGRNPYIAVERVAVNLKDFRIPDNSGQAATDELIRLHGPTAYFATLPVRDIVNAMQANGVPAQLSMSAGTYLCNQIMYEVLDYVAERGDQIPAGFIHVPMLPEQVAHRRPTPPSMNLDTMVQGIGIALHTIASEVSA